jgi:ribokinase
MRRLLEPRCRASTARRLIPERRKRPRLEGLSAFRRRRLGVGVRDSRPMRVAVVGHVEWIEFARVERLPEAGEIVHALESWEEPGGGGAVAAVQLARLAGECLFLTALGDDSLGHRAKRELEELGLRVEAFWHPGPQRRAFVHLDANAERTITVIGERLGPRGADRCRGPSSGTRLRGPWRPASGGRRCRLSDGRRRGRGPSPRRTSSWTRSFRALRTRGSATARRDLTDPPPHRSHGWRRGGSLETADGRSSRWEGVPLPGPAVDAYGAGDSFAAGLTYGLGEGRSPEEALALGARCGAACVTGRGPYQGQLRSAGGD